MPPEVVLGFILALIIIALFMTLVGRYKRCPSNRVLVIFGRTGSGAAKPIHGGAAFVWPLLQDYAYLDLEPFAVPISLDNALSRENIRVSVPTTVTAAIATEGELMVNAAVRLLGLSQDEIKAQAEDIILGQMRAVIATMAIEEINRDRQAFMGKVNEAVSSELEKVGLSVINVNIRDIQDESGYIEALGRKAAAEAINQALIDVAEQEKTGQSGVAERQRDRRRAVAAADADAVIGEKQADRNQRAATSELDAEAVAAEAVNEARKARALAEQRVAEQQARQKAEEASRVADGAIRVAEENAQRLAEAARAEREQVRLQAEVLVPENQEVGIVLHGGHEPELAAHAARVGAHLAAEHSAVQAQPFEKLALKGRAAGTETRKKVENLAAGQRRPPRHLAGQVAQAGLVAAAVRRDVLLEYLHAAAIRPQQIEEQADARRFSRPVGSQKAEDLALHDREREVLDADDAAVGLAQAAHENDGSRCGHRSIEPGFGVNASVSRGRIQDGLKMTIFFQLCGFTVLTANILFQAASGCKGIKKNALQVF